MYGIRGPFSAVKALCEKGQQRAQKGFRGIGVDPMAGVRNGLELGLWKKLVNERGVLVANIPGLGSADE